VVIDLALKEAATDQIETTLNVVIDLVVKALIDLREAATDQIGTTLSVVIDLVVKALTEAKDLVGILDVTIDLVAKAQREAKDLVKTRAIEAIKNLRLKESVVVK
jgi:hypothetical protein